MTRSPDAIKSLFDSNKAGFYAFISKDLYQRSHMQFFVHALRNSYEVMRPALEREDVLRSLMHSEHVVDPKMLGKVCVQSQTENISKHTAGMPSAFVIKYAKEVGAIEEWLCAFWIRRNKEKSATILFDVLTEIAEHYGDIAAAGK